MFRDTFPRRCEISQDLDLSRLRYYNDYSKIVCTQKLICTFNHELSPVTYATTSVHMMQSYFRAIYYLICSICGIEVAMVC